MKEIVIIRNTSKKIVHRIKIENVKNIEIGCAKDFPCTGQYAVHTFQLPPKTNIAIIFLKNGQAISVALDYYKIIGE